MKYLLIAILLLGACSAQYFNQEEVEASFENDFGDLDAMTKDMDFDEENLLEDAQDEEDPFDMYDDMEDDEEDYDLPEEVEFDDEDFDFENYDPSMDFLEDGEEEDFEGEDMDMEDMTPEEAFFWKRFKRAVRRTVRRVRRVTRRVTRRVRRHVHRHARRFGRNFRRRFGHFASRVRAAARKYGPRALAFAKKWGPKIGLFLLKNAWKFAKCKKDVITCGGGIKTMNFWAVKRGCLGLCHSCRPFIHMAARVFGGKVEYWIRRGLRVCNIIRRYSRGGIHALKRAIMRLVFRQVKRQARRHGRRWLRRQFR
jgi:hypothetical protein